MNANDQTKTFRIVAMIMIVVGGALLAYGAYTYFDARDDAATTVSRDDAVADVGTGGVLTGEDSPITIPVIAGLLSLGIGVALLFVQPNLHKPGRVAGPRTPRSVP